MVDVSARFRYNADFGPLQAQIKALTRDIGMLNASFVAMDRAALASKKDLSQSFAANINATGQFRASFVDLTSATEQFGRAIDKRTLSLREYFREARKVYQQDSRASRLAERQVAFRQAQVIGMGPGPSGRQQAMVVRPLKIDTSDYMTKMQLAAEKYAIFNRLVDDGATKLINWGKNTQWAGRQLTVGLTMPLVLFGASVSKVFRDVDKELTRFAKVYGSDLVGANANATKEMRKQIQELAIEYSRAYGIAAKETAALAADLAATGLEGEKLTGSLAQTTRLSVLGEVDRQEAMRTTLALQSAFQQSTKELADSINFLNAVENQTSASLDDFTAAIPKAGPVVRQLGGDVKDLAVMLTAMREGGIPAAEAANAIKSGLASMINPTKAASERLAQLGVDIQGIVNRNRGELMPTLNEFGSVINQLDSFARAKVIEELFGKYQFARISALFDNLNRQGSQTAQVLELMGASSADLAKVANQEINTLTESLSMKFTRAVEGFKASLLPIGEVMTASIIPFIEGATTVIGKMIDVFNALPEPVKNAGKFLMGLAAAAGPIIMLTGVFGNFLGYMTKGILSMNNFARRLMGLPVSRLEILDDQTIAAARATDILTDSFSREASSLQVLNTQLRNYVTNLRSAANTSPALFVPGSPARPLRRSTGGDIPGYGGGDKVPALLEPGEFVVRKEVASKNRGFLRDLNSGKVRGYNDGGDVVDKNDRVERFAARAHIISPDEFYRLVKNDPELRGLVAGLTDLDFSRDNAKLFAKGFGAYTSAIFPQFLNNAFVNLPGAPEWMKNGVPFNSREAEQMISLLETTPNKKSMHDEAIKYLRENFVGKSREEISSNLAKRIAASTLLAKGHRPNDPIFDNELSRESSRLSRIISGSSDPRYALARETLLLGAPARLIIGTTEADKRSAAKLPRKMPVGVIASVFDDVVPYTQRGRTTPSNTTSGAAPTIRPTGRTQALGPRGLLAARRHTPINLMPNEVAVPPQYYADDGAMIDDRGNVRPLNIKPSMSAEEFRARWDSLDPKNNRMEMSQRRGMMGSSLMNIGFAGSMLAGMTAMNGEVTAATTALTAFTTALMVAGTALEVGQMFGGRGRGGAPGGAAGRRGFLGLRGAGAAMQARGAGMAANAGGMAGRFGGAALLNGGRALAMLGGPVGIGIAATLTAAVVAYQLHQKHLEDLRKSATAAFSEASQSAEYFGISLGATSEKAQDFRDTLDRMGINFSSAADQIDEDFIQRVGSDYEDLINRMTGRKDVEGIARDFELAYSSLISKGFGADEANAILEEVARQAQQTEVYVNVKGRWQGIDTPEEAAASIVENIPEAIEKAKEFLNPEKMKQDAQAAMETLIDQQNAARQALEDRIKNENIDFYTAQGLRTEMELQQRLDRERLERAPLFDKDIAAAEATLEMAPEGAAAGLRALLEAYKNAPVEVAPYIDKFNKKVSEIFEGNDEAMLQYGGQIQAMFKEAVGEDPVLMAAFDKLPNDLEGIRAKTLMLQAANLGLKDSIYGFIDEYGNIDTSGLDSLIQKTLTLTSLNERMDDALQSAIDATKQEIKETDQAFNKRIKKQEKVIDGLQDEAEIAQEKHDDYMDGLDAESRALDKRAEKIQENADKQQDFIDKQIKSLQISQEEATFAQQQRQRAFGLLGALMSGDAGAFEEARLDFAQAQEDRQRELAIQGLEDRKEKIAEEADAKLDAIDKEKEAIDERARAASKAHEEYMKQNQENQEAAQDRIQTLDKERNKIVKNLQAGINLLQQARDQGYLTQTQATELDEKLGRLSSKLPAGARKALTELSDGLFGPNGEYTRLVNGLITEMATALNVSEQDVRDMLGKELRGQYSNPNREGAEGKDGWDRPGATGPGYSYIPGRAKGGPAPIDPMGMVRGPGTQTSDSILARLSKDEYVVRASSVNKIGKNNLDYMNATGKLPTFAEGSPGGVGNAAGGFWGTGPNAMSILSLMALENLYTSAVSNIRNTPGTTGAVPAGEGSQWLANFLSSMGLSGEQLRVAYAIAMRESSGRPNLVSTMDGNGYGLFQIQFGVGHANTLNTVLGSNVTDNESDRQKFAELMFDPQNNFKVMMHMSKNMEDLGAWGLYSWRNPTLNTRDYGRWTASQHQAWIMEPFLRYYASFPGVDPSFGGTTTGFPTGTVPGGGAAPGPAGAGRTLSGWPAIPPSVSGSYLTMTNSPSSSKEFYVAKWAVPMFEALMQSWQSNPSLGGGRLTLNSGSSGSYDYRQARASSGWSDHAGGTAVDFRYDILPPFAGYQMTSSERSAVAQMLNGPLGRVFGWGGNYDMAYMDEMHFYLKPNNGIIPAFASGGLVGKSLIPGFRYGGMSADRAETAANNNVYAGGWKPKTTSPFIRGGGSYKGWGTGKAGAGFSAMGSAISKSVSEQGIWGTIKNMASAIKEDPMSLIPFYGLSSIDTSTQEGKDIMQAAAIMEILGVIPGAGIPFKGISMAARSGTRAASSSVKTTSLSAIKSPIARKILNPLAQRAFDRSNNKARQFLDETDMQQRNIGMMYDNAIVAELIRRGDTPAGSNTPGLRLDYYGDNPISKSAIATFMKDFAYPRDSHSALLQRSYSYGGEKRPISMYTRPQMEQAYNIFKSIPTKDSDNFPLHPSHRAYLMEESDAFKALSPTDQKAVKNLWQRYDGYAENLPQNSAGLDYHGWLTGQVNIHSPGESLFGFLSTVGHEAGHTLDSAWGVSGRGGSGKSSVFQGKTEALAEANRLRSTSELLRSIGITNPEYMMKPGGVQSYFPGVFLSGNKMQYGSSPLFKWHYARQMSKNLKGKQGPIFYPGKGFKMRGAGLYSDIIRSVPAWLAGKYLGYSGGGQSKDNILARVSSGEYIMSAPAVSSIGIKNMDMINEGRLPGFNTGGFVGDPRFKLPKKKSLNNISESKSVAVRQGTNIEYNINIDVAQTDASPDDIANRVLRTLRSNENSRRLRSNG